jgi:hypothetical protein
VAPNCTTIGNLSSATALNDSLQLPRITQRILDNQLAHIVLVVGAGRRSFLLVTALGGLGLLIGEVDPAVPEGPAAGAGKVDDGALRLEEEEGLCGRDGEGRVGSLAAGGDLVADLGGEDLFCWGKV